MIREYEIDYSKKIPKLRLVHEHSFNEDMTDIGMVALFFMEFIKADEKNIESIYIIAYDGEDRLIGITKVADGDLGSVDIDNKKIITFLILSGGSQFIVEHNHPNGISTPSQRDKYADGALKTIATMFNLTYLGGLVIGNGEFSVINGSENVEM